MTGGGGNIAMKASSIAPNFWLSCIAIAPPLSSGLSRSSNGFSVTNTMPAFELLVKPAIDRPGKATALSTPGCSRAMSLMRRITSSVRSSVAPSGSWAKPTRYCLSWAGTKPSGTALKTPTVTPSSDEIEPHHQRLAREHPPDAAAVGPRAVPEDEVEAAEQPAEQPVQARGSGRPRARRVP